MKKLAVFLVLFGLLPQISDLNAANRGKAVPQANGIRLFEVIKDHQQEWAKRFCVYLQGNGNNGIAGRNKAGNIPIWQRVRGQRDGCDIFAKWQNRCEERNPCVPEPSSALAGLLALGLGFAGWRRMRPTN